MEIVFAAGRPDDPILAHFSFYTFGRWVLAKQKQACRASLFYTLGVLKQNALPDHRHTKFACSLRLHCPARHRAVFCVAFALEGRRKPVSLASEVSADLSDFLTLRGESG